MHSPTKTPRGRTVRPSDSFASLNPNRPVTPLLLRRPASSASVRSGTPGGGRATPVHNAMYGTTPGASANVYHGSIHVAVRIKPGSTLQDWVHDESSIYSRELGGVFAFDRIYSDHSNAEVFEHSVGHVVDQVMDGYNGTVFAYGMTGTGKTYSMQGTAQDPGVVALAVQSIFRHLHRSQSFSIRVGYMEIYNEHVHDLLAATAPGYGGGGSMANEIRLRDDALTGGVRAAGLTEVEVRSSDALLDLIEQGDALRRTEGTEFNARSSRSHAIIQITIQNNGTTSTLYLCDLAGSERAAAQSERRKEGAYINKSLLTLGTVIARLSTGSGHVPYRDSKLTRLLQPALSGKSLVAVLCTIHMIPQLSSIETVSTLRFAARAKNIQVQVKRNEAGSSGDDARVEKLLLQIQQQKLEIQRLRESRDSTRTSGSSLSSGSSPLSASQLSQISQLEAENKILNERVEHLTRLVDDSHLDQVLGLDSDAASVESNPSSGVSGRQVDQVDEYKSYISHLEKQLYQHELQARQQQQQAPSSPTPSEYGPNNKQLYYHQVIRELKDQVDELRESNRDKDRVIAALQNVNKQRENFQAYARYYNTPASKLDDESSPVKVN